MESLDSSGADGTSSKPSATKSSSSSPPDVSSVPRDRNRSSSSAAVWAAFLHGSAGERLSEKVGRLGFLAREIAPEIPRLIDEILD